MFAWLHWAWCAFKTRGGLRPVMGQIQQPLSLLLGPSPGGPPEAISCQFVVLVDRGHAPPFFSGSATGLSAINARRHSPRAGGLNTMRLSVVG
jgi:hypothetical protein